MMNHRYGPLLLLVLLISLGWIYPVHAEDVAPAALANSNTVDPHATQLDFRRGLLAAAEFHSCAIDSNGSVACWGDNGNGRLGDGTEIDRSSPVQVVGLTSGVVAVVAGEEHTCALVGSPGAVKCWGQRTKNGSDADSSLPLTVPGLAQGVTAISASHDHTCAIVNGGVLCWGLNRDGALGNDSTDHSATPVQVVGLTTGVQQVSAGADFACAVLQDGSVRCWGDNGSGELGDGTTEAKSTPVPVAGLSETVVEIAASGGFACARTASGKLYCWGFNGNGELGNGTTTTPVLAPTEVQGLGGPVAAIAVARSHSCALLADGRVQCWGPNLFGQLGTACVTNSRALPQYITGLNGNIIALQPGWNHTCAMSSRGHLYCWGNNSRGQIGLPPLGDSPTPVTATLLSKANQALALGAGHSCVLRKDGGVTCWGVNSFGQLGNGTDEGCLDAVDVLGLQSNVVDLAAGLSHTCAVMRSEGMPDEVYCWGQNNLGQLGDGTTETHLEPVKASPAISNVVQLAAGDRHTCALMEPSAGQRRVNCWGDNDFLQIEASATISDALSLWTGIFKSCVIRTAGDLYCWGDGQLAAFTVSVETLGGKATAYAAGQLHACAIVDGGVRCWGVGASGQLGAGELITSTATPTDVVGISGVAEVLVSGADHTCALADGKVFCWGLNDRGQAGTGDFEDVFAATQVAGLSGVESIAAGSNHTCAILGDDSVKCWGSRSRGNLGDGQADVVPTPYCFDDFCQDLFLPATERP